MNSNSNKITNNIAVSFYNQSEKYTVILIRTFFAVATAAVVIYVKSTHKRHALRQNEAH